MKTNNQPYTKRLSLMMLVATFGLFAVIAFALTPLYSLSNTDILVSVTVVPELLRTLIDLTEVAVFAIGFSIIIFSVFLRFSAVRLVLIYFGAVVFRRLGALIMSLAMNGAIGIDDIFSSISNLVLEVVLLGAVLWIANNRKNRYYRLLALRSRSSSLFKDENASVSTIADLYPFKKIYSKENPIQSCALIIAGLLSAVKIISRIIFDISYGAPADFGEVLIMAVYYLSDVLIGIVFYAISTLVLTRLFRWHQKTNA